MRFKRKCIELRKVVNRTYFALLPVTIGYETRWLETVTVRGYWFIGAVSGDCIFMELEFID